uniref:Uncharacterized protein n=1 Tax=Anguilla anguilla TaxID=7936 RepID=A0A0E9W3J1_ANGAN
MQIHKKKRGGGKKHFTFPKCFISFAQHLSSLCHCLGTQGWQGEPLCLAMSCLH